MNVFSEDFIKLLPEDMRADAVSLEPVAVLDMLRAQKRERDARQNAATRGQRGEAWVYDQLAALPECRVEKVAATKWSGDFVIHRMVGARNVTIMVDVKNYTNPVPRDEVAKFHRDMEVRKHDAGLLLSLNTKFVGGADTEFAFSTLSAAGRDAQVALLTSNHPDVIIHAVRYLFSLAAVRRHVTMGDSVVAHLHEARSRIDQMARMRHEIQALQQTVTTGLSRLGQDVLDIEVRTTVLLDAIFGEIDAQPRTEAYAATIEEKMGVSLRSSTLRLFQYFPNAPLQATADNKHVYLHSEDKTIAKVTRMAKLDRIVVDLHDNSRMPGGNYSVKDGQITFDLESSHDLEVARYLIEQSIGREELLP